MEVEPVESVRMNIYQRNIFKLDTTRRRAKGSREAASEGLTVLHIRFCSLSNNYKKQLAAPTQARQQDSKQGHMIDLGR